MVPQRRKPTKSRATASAAGPCSIDTILTQGICPCLQQIRSAVTAARGALDRLGDPGALITSVWPATLTYGPKTIKAGSKKSRGWWFRVYKPALTIDPSKLTLTVKVGVKKTRGTPQFPWRKAGHTFKLDAPPELAQYFASLLDLGTRLETLESALAQVQDTFNCPA